MRGLSFVGLGFGGRVLIPCLLRLGLLIGNRLLFRRRGLLRRLLAGMLGLGGGGRNAFFGILGGNNLYLARCYG